MFCCPTMPPCACYCTVFALLQMTTSGNCFGHGGVDTCTLCSVSFFASHHMSNDMREVTELNIYIVPASQMRRPFRSFRQYLADWTDPMAYAPFKANSRWTGVSLCSSTFQLIYFLSILAGVVQWSNGSFEHLFRL